jgi:multiple sugar transport system ATP-binding protein
MKPAAGSRRGLFSACYTRAVPELILRRLTKLYPDGVQAVRELDLQVNDGELMVIVGPSGSGKTTILRLIAGLETPNAGTIQLGDRVLDGLPPGRRGVAMVFQEHGLYPHLSVHDNLVFNPRLRRVGRLERERLAQPAAELVDVAHLLPRMPRTLSGGERQRVAVGRALTAEPQCLLFDEPLSNLDARLREQIRSALKTLHRHLGRTTLYVTHDQQEATTLGDRLAVMWAGALQQVGTPGEIFERPVNRFVAGFVGAPPMSFIEGMLEPTAAGPLFTDGHDVRLRLPEAAAEAVGRNVVLGIRPHALRPAPPTGGADGRTIRIMVEAVEALGACADVRGATSRGDRITATFEAARVPGEGQRVDLIVASVGLHLFEPGELGRRIAR